MAEQQDSLLDERDACLERTAGQMIAYKYFTAQSSLLSILGSSVSVTGTLLCWSISILFAMEYDIYSHLYIQ